MEVLASNMTKINVLGKRDIKEANAVLSLWERVQLDGRIYRLAKKFREKIEIPNDGFDSSNKFETWHKQIKIKGKELERITNTNQFIEKSKQLFPYQGIMREVHFRLLMLSFLYYNEVDSEDLNKWRYSEMGVEIIKNGKEFFAPFKEITDGVYIKIGPFSTIDNINKYIDHNRDLIRSALNLYIKSEKIKKPKGIKGSPKFERNSLIIGLNKYSKKEIEKYFQVKADYKYMAIVSLMKEAGYAGVTDEIVRAVIQRRKIKM